jgi:hypothetical protein
MKQKQQAPSKLHINCLLEGEEVERFLRYKSGAYLRNNSEAGRKLMLERLSQVEKQQAAETANA